ncbi:NMD3-related protein [Methanosarcina barkeri]|uniref:NMD3-related protein n=1 Tax=Methanosarcina barkeri TaxID=2208 RepID=UPI000A707F3C
MGSMNASRQICRLITSELGGNFSESPTLVGMKDGKNLYRITFAVRLPEFRPGDVIKFRGKIIQIKSSGKKRLMELPLRTAQDLSQPLKS